MKETLKIQDELLDKMLNEKEKIYKLRLKDNGKVEIYIQNDQIICYKFFKDFILPLPILMQYKDILPTVQVDKGATKFILNGADIMCQGLTSNGGKLNKANKDQIVLVMVEGKMHPIAVGKMEMSEEEI